jgi:hypothetical protein
LMHLRRRCSGNISEHLALFYNHRDTHQTWLDITYTWYKNSLDLAVLLSRYIFSFMVRPISYPVIRNSVRSINVYP